MNHHHGNKMDGLSWDRTLEDSAGAVKELKNYKPLEASGVTAASQMCLSPLKTGNWKCSKV